MYFYLFFDNMTKNALIFGIMTIEVGNPYYYKK